MTSTPAAPKRKFVPADLDPADWAQVEPLYRALLDRPINSPREMHRWLLDLSELSAVMSEYGSRKNIDKTCHTDDSEIEKAYLHYLENIRPKIQPLFFELQKKFLASPHHAALDGPNPATAGKFAVLTREWKADVEIFRAENVPLQTQISKLSSDYDKICGAMLVEFRGQQYTLQQIARFLEEPDRPTRQKAWEITASRRLQERDAIDGIFEKQLDLRAEVAKNAGFPDFRGYAWKSMMRFDYTPEDCLRFADAIEGECVPVVKELNRRRAEELKLPRLRPWDLAVDPQSRPPLKPFAPERSEELLAKCQSVFEKLSPALGEDFALLKPGKNLDLESRKAKRGGGYQSSLEEIREPFIFMNAAGLQRDVETLLHEGGHAFHYLAARAEPLVFLRHAPIEFCEVASMSMELMGRDHFDVFYPDASNANRARATLLEGIIRILPWIATIDGFQHWLYTHPGHSRAERYAAWLDIFGRFSDPALDYTGYEAARETRWQAQLHLFHHPFYYIEYGIAQLGALQLWIQFRNDRKRALENYRAALKLGGTRPLPELFKAAGIRFDFSDQTLRPLMEEVGRVMREFPA
jgi:oligoendopeptidase F